MQRIAVLIHAKIGRRTLLRQAFPRRARVVRTQVACRAVEVAHFIAKLPHRLFEAVFHVFQISQISLCGQLVFHIVYKRLDFAYPQTRRTRHCRQPFGAKHHQCNDPDQHHFA